MRSSTLVLLTIAVALLTVPVVAQPPEEPTKRALLVGINDYENNDDLADLEGCANDVELMREVLIGKFDFPPENIRVLTDGEATRAAILEAIQSHLIAPSREGDVAVLHYSGHGSQMPDNTGDELDGLDETLVPHDARTPGVFDISDDEINGLMTRLSGKTPHVVFVLDSCHSGSAARAAATGNRVRQAKADKRQPPPPAPFARSGTIDQDDDFRLPGSGYVLISGSRASELSNEAEFGGRQHGALTHHLANVLRSAGGERLTYRDVMERVEADVTARFPSQHPQIEGTGVDDMVFGVERVIPSPYVLVEPAGEGRVEISAGELFGLGTGTVLDVYPPGTKDFEASETTARVKVTEVGPLSSRGAIESGSLEPQSRAVLDAVRPTDFHVGVFFEGDSLSPLLEQVRSSLAEHDSLEMVGERSAADIRIRDTGSVIRLEGRDLQVLGEVAKGDSATETATKVTDLVAHWGRWYAVLAIDNPGAGLEVDLAIARHETPETPPAPEVVDAVEPTGGEVMPEAVPEGSWVTITATNRSPQEVHLTILDLTSKGAISVLYPPADITEAVPSGKAVKLTLQAFVPEGQDSVVDWVKVIATSSPIPTGLFRLEPRSRSARVAAPADEGPLNRYLRSWVQGGTRDLGGGPGLQPVAVDGWAVTQRVVRVERDAPESSGVAVHFASAEEADRAREGLRSGSRGICGAALAGAQCYDVEPVPGDDTILTVRTQRTRSTGGREVSVGTSFEEAYEVRRETGAQRAEPLLAVELDRAPTAPRLEDQALEGTRGGGGDELDPRVADNPLWSLQFTRVPEAWQALRQSRGSEEGREAAGVVVSHPDTGYLRHPEIWSDAEDSPLWAAAGWDYHGDDDDAVDDTSGDRLLDNPVHGTGSGSAIVSPAGCQLEGATLCPTGVARGARLVPLRVNRSVVNFHTGRITAAIRDAAGGDRTRVKTASDLSAIAMGGVPSWALWKAVRQAEEEGHLIIAAAGNYVKTVVWPARFSSTIAVAAVDAGCRPWSHSSLGPAVDFAAPGVDVWRATAQGEDLTFITGTGTGTTYATATTAGIAALWIARHRGTPEFEEIRSEGRTTEVFRELVRRTAWRPDGTNRPPAAECDPGAGWFPGFFGAGIIDAAALLAEPLPTGATRGGREASRLEELPLWASLYPRQIALAVVRDDYRRLFALDAEDDAETVAVYEAEVMYHVATDPRVQEAVHAVVLRNERGEEAYRHIRQALLTRDLSPSLRRALEE